MNIFMLLDLSIAEGTEAALVAWQWDTALDSNTLMSYTDTAVLMTKQRISQIIGWEGQPR